MKLTHLAAAIGLACVSASASAYTPLTFTYDADANSFLAELSGTAGDEVFGFDTRDFSAATGFTLDGTLSTSALFSRLGIRLSGTEIIAVVLDGDLRSRAFFDLSSDTKTASNGKTVVEYDATLLNHTLTAGWHTLTVTATGNYAGGTVSLTPAVPEPESLALALAGLGVAGFVARRRSQG
ncbi:FxDxF family PEP-CTERM protein [Aquabacterium sp.]|uniref:FxDxF family PEP-CTERM protein n=1 Tax=Aquabacterium sp. TaxID=1872578 RepID=UPI0025BEBF32|nr:FxDxF family PEP-CTERM protein [Aquabacterium sp.]